MNIKKMKATFYLKGGHKLVIRNLRTFSAKMDNKIGGLETYKYETVKGKKVPFLHDISLQDVVLVKVENYYFW